MNTPNPNRKFSLNLLVAINPPCNLEKLDRLYQKAGFPIQHRFKAEGTASNEIMDYLGLTSRDKAVTISIVPRFATARAIRMLSDELGLYKPGNGIAFSVPLSAISGQAVARFTSHFSDEMIQQLENEVNQLLDCSGYCLVLATVGPGYSEEVMETAKECGVTGGTVIHARRLGNEEKMKFWGISVQSEREIIAIIVERDKRLELMQAIGEKYGIQSKAHGMIFSLPVEGMAGLGPVPEL